MNTKKFKFKISSILQNTLNSMIKVVSWFFIVNIAFFISDHGYGHGTRTQALLELVWRSFTKEELNITLCSEKINTIIAKELLVHGYHVKTFPIQTEYGIFANSSGSAPDIYHTLTQLPSWVSHQLSLLDTLKKWFIDNKIDCVLTDISPFPLEAASAVGLPCAGISNFTWSDQYEIFYRDILLGKEHIHLNNKAKIYHAMEKIALAYNGATRAFLYPFSLSMRGFENIPHTKLSLIARKSKLDKKQAKKFILEILSKPYKSHSELESINDLFIVYIGLGMSLTFTDNIKEFFQVTPKNWLFIGPPSLSPFVKNSFSNVIALPEGLTSSHDWIRGCDLIITKPGYSTVSEALINEIPLVILDVDIPEANVIKTFLLENNYAINITLDTLVEKFASHPDEFKSLKPANLPRELSEQTVSKFIDFLTNI